MHKPQEKVRQFRWEVLGELASPTRAAYVGSLTADTRARYLVEEAGETAAALVGGARAREILLENGGLPLDTECAAGAKCLPAKPDLVAVVDGGVDTIYVAYGLFEELSLDAEPFFDAVHAANMRKAAGPKEGEPWKTGAKPPGWVSPEGEIRKLLDEADKRDVAASPLTAEALARAVAEHAERTAYLAGREALTDARAALAREGVLLDLLRRVAGARGGPDSWIGVDDYCVLCGGAETAPPHAPYGRAVTFKRGHHALDCPTVPLQAFYLEAGR